MHLDEETCSVGPDSAISLTLQKGDLFSPFGSDTILGRFDICAVVAASIGVLIAVCPTRWRTGLNSSSSLSGFLKYFEFAGLLFSTIVFVAIIVLHERYLLGSARLPMLLPITSYEQWNCWAAAGLIVLATGVNAIVSENKSQGPVDRVAQKTAEDPPWVTLDTTDNQNNFAKTALPPISVEKPWRGRKSDLEWAGVMGKRTPNHVS
jgi:hypothetical protein